MTDLEIWEAIHCKK